jgi:hypothetical protein
LFLIFIFIKKPGSSFGGPYLIPLFFSNKHEVKLKERLILVSIFEVRISLQKIMLFFPISQSKIKPDRERVKVPYLQTLFAGSQHCQAPFKKEKYANQQPKKQYQAARCA